MAMKEEDLCQLKRADLQRLAKLHGIKANKKNADIIKDLVECFNEKQEEELNRPIENVNIQNSPKGTCAESCEPNNGDQLLKNQPEDQNSSMCKENIPKSEVFLERISETESAPTTKIPKLVGGSILKEKKKINFKEIHSKHFNQMESIEDYIEKKKQRANQLKFSLKAAANDAVKVLTTMKKYHNTPTTAKKEKQVGSSVKSIKHASGKAKVDSWHTERTISRKTFLDFRSPLTKFELPKENSATKKFDLKESLKKPLAYKPHRGKLRGLNEPYIHKENRAEQRQIAVKCKNRTQTDNKERRKGCMKSNRAVAKEKLLERRRGLKA